MKHFNRLPRYFPEKIYASFIKKYAISSVLHYLISNHTICGKSDLFILKNGGGYQHHLKEIFGVTPKYFKWLHMEDSFDVTQYRVKRMCNKTGSNTDLLPLFWTSKLQLWTSRK